MISVLMGPFIIGAVAVTALPGWNLAVKAIGIVLAIAFLISILRARMRVAPEPVLHFTWVAWCLVGVFVMVSSLVFWEAWITVIQISAMFLIMSCYSVSRKTFTFSMLMFFLGFVILAASGYVSGEYERSEDVGTRLASLSLNSNVFAWVMVLSLVMLAYFWMQKTRLAWLKYTALGIGMSLVAVQVVLSGSRMGLLGMAVFFAAWVWFCYRRVMFRRLHILIIVTSAALVGGGLFIPYLLASHTAWERVGFVFSFWETGYDPEGSARARFALLQDAWTVFSQNPLVGVGLSQYAMHSSKHYMTHSELGEIGTSSGLPGLIIYLAIFVILWLRCGKIRKHSPDTHAADVAGLVRTLLIVMLAVSLTTIFFYDKATWIMLGCMVGYTNRLWHDLRDTAISHAGLPSAASLPLLNPSLYGSGLRGPR